MENKNNILIILVVSLILIVIGLTGFIVYDKVLSNGSYAGGSDNSSENDYKVFVKNVKSNMAKHESNSYLSLLNTIIEDGYEVSLDENGSLFVRYYNEEINSRYGNYKIADNVLSFTYLLFTKNNWFERFERDIDGFPITPEIFISSYS